MLLFFIWKSYTALWRQLPCFIYTIPALHHSHDTNTHNTCGVFGARASNLPATRRRRVVLYENIVLALIADVRRVVPVAASTNNGPSRAVRCIVRRGDKGVRLQQLPFYPSCRRFTHTRYILLCRRNADASLPIHDILMLCILTTWCTTRCPFESKLYTLNALFYIWFLLCVSPAVSR